MCVGSAPPPIDLHLGLLNRDEREARNFASIGATQHNQRDHQQPERDIDDPAVPVDGQAEASEDPVRR